MSLEVSLFLHLLHLELFIHFVVLLNRIQHHPFLLSIQNFLHRRITAISQQQAQHIKHDNVQIMVFFLLCHFESLLDFLFHEQIHLIQIIKKSLVKGFADILDTLENGLDKLVKAQADSQDAVDTEVLAHGEEIFRVLVLNL